LAEAEQRLVGRAFTIITQNIDGLHQRAGSANVIELHGSVFRSRCSNASCERLPFEDEDDPCDELPSCPDCGSVLRPDVVLFNEFLPGGVEWHAKRALRDCDLFVAVGTSGTVAPASNFVRSAKYAGARTVFVNGEPLHPRHPAYDGA
jgi:NAD-dependent deacetylase